MTTGVHFLQFLRPIPTFDGTATGLRRDCDGIATGLEMKKPHQSIPSFFFQKLSLNYLAS